MEVYKSREVAERLRVTQRTVTNWCNTGRLKATRIGRQWRIDGADLALFIRNGIPKVDEQHRIAA